MRRGQHSWPVLPVLGLEGRSPTGGRVNGQAIREPDCVSVKNTGFLYLRNLSSGIIEYQHHLLNGFEVPWPSTRLGVLFSFNKPFLPNRHDRVTNLCLERLESVNAEVVPFSKALRSTKYLNEQKTCIKQRKC